MGEKPKLFNMKNIRIIYPKEVAAARGELASAWFPDTPHHKQQFLHVLEKTIGEGGPGTYLIEVRTE